MRYQSIPPLSEKDKTRFWSKVDRSGGPDACWIWNGTLQKGGYGTMCLAGSGRKRMYIVHRVSYAMHHGSTPEDRVLDHLCRNRQCVNPLHLEPVTIGENVLRGDGVNAVALRENVCKRGHELTGDNVKMMTGKNGKPKRTCRTCFNEASMRSYRRHRDAINKRRRERHAAT